MDKCSNCGLEPPDKSSKKGYCLPCSRVALDAFHRKMEETNKKREEQRKRLGDMVSLAEIAAKAKEVATTYDIYTISSVIIRPGTCDIATFLKRNGYPMAHAGSVGGSRLSPPPDILVTKTFAWAEGYAAKLREFGYNAIADIKEM